VNGSRRAFLAQIAAAAAALAIPDRAEAMGRTPLGGRFRMHIPWPTSSLDPHDLRDPTAAIFGSAVADPIFGLDGAGNPFPTLAASLPSRESVGVVVRLRDGLRTARLAPLDARDLVASVERSRSRGGAALLADIPKPSPHPGDPNAVIFSGADAARVARALASPLVALLPRKFNPVAPDATGAFRAELAAGKLTLTRNLNAARGAAFLDGIDVDRADDLRTSLREFEGAHDDVGWLGAGLHGARPGAVRFDLGPVAWVVLATGPEAGSFHAPGVAQRLADAVPERIAHLGLGVLPAAQGDPGWGGPPADLLVDETCPHLVEVARAVAPSLSRSGHEVTVLPVPRAELARRRARGKSSLAIDLARPLGPGPLLSLLALATADDPGRARELAKRPPKLSTGASARSLTSSLRVGVLGEIRVTGGAIPDLMLARSPAGDGWDLSATFRRPTKK
jgi:peptide/nickel transport system substrate-binding protein